MISRESGNLSLLLWVCGHMATLSREGDLGRKVPCQEFHDLSLGRKVPEEGRGQHPSPTLQSFTHNELSVNQPSRASSPEQLFSFSPSTMDLHNLLYESFLKMLYFAFPHAKIDFIRSDTSFQLFSTCLVPGCVIHRDPFSLKT